MRIDIILNDSLIREAFRYTSVSSTQELIELALDEFVENHRRHDVQELKGNITIRPDYNYKKLRANQCK